MNIKTKDSFTLLEIIIVIIIVGVLVSLALPRFFKSIEFSRSSEALQNIGIIHQAILSCGMVANDYTNCENFGFLGGDPGEQPDAHFKYMIQIIGNPQNPDIQITASRNGLDAPNGNPTLDEVTILYTPRGITRSGTGAFESIK